MWQRFKRALRALFGGAVQAIEDPKLVLEQNIRDLNDQVPRMNENIATVKASVTLLEKDVARQQAEHDDLMSKIKAAINQGRDDIAANYALRVESLGRNLEASKAELAQSQAAYAKALEVKKAFMREREKKIKEAQDALKAYERSKWQAKVADAMASFEVAGIDQTHSEMVNKLNEKAAKNEAKLDIALDTVDTTSYKVDEEAEKLRAMDLVRKMKQDMGVSTPAAEAPGEAARASE